MANHVGLGHDFNFVVSQYRLDDLANERLEAIRLQEQRARIYEETFNPKHVCTFALCRNLAMGINVEILDAIDLNKVKS